ncbi:MAG: hypothetical protein AAB263_13785, partial [Planctomycetota bacterium]
MQVFKTKFFTFANRTDPLMVRAETANGGVIQYFGDKDERGLAKAVTAISVQDATGETTFITLDENVRPSQVLVPNGEIYQFDWKSSTVAQVTATSADHATQISFSLDFAATAQGGSDRTEHEHKADGEAREVATTSLLTSEAIAADFKTTVKLTECGAPVSGALVTMRVATAGDIFLFRSREFVAHHAPNDPAGAYTVRISSADLGASERYREICESFAKALGVACDSLPPNRNAAFIPLFCAQVSAAALAVGAAPPSFVGCLAVLTAFELYCETIEFGPVAAPGLADKLFELRAIDHILNPLTIPVITTFSVNGKLQPKATRPTIPPDISIDLSDCEPITLRVEVVGTGNGTVVSDPGGIACGKPGCSARFQPPTEVTLRVRAEAGSKFVGWEGACIPWTLGACGTV